jgi:hypothetical protein
LIAAVGASAARTAGASERVSISYGEPSLQPFAERLASELGSDGYAVAVVQGGDPSPCEQPAVGAASAGSSADAAWVRLAFDPAGGDAVIASICFRSTVSLLQRVAARGTRAEPERFALTTAEALNGLRAQVPLVSTRAAVADRAAVPPAATPSASPSTAPAENSVALSQTALLDLGGFPVLWGVGLHAQLGVTPALRLTIESFAPISAAELANQQAQVQTRLTWLRAGVEARLTQGAARLGCSLLAGPALSWATAEAEPPYIGAADVALSGLITLAGSVEYPSNSPVFVLGAARFSTLLPGVRVAVGGDTSHTLGPWLAEASLGVGVRWAR